MKAVAPLEGGNRESVGEGDRQGRKERARRTEEQLDLWFNKVFKRKCLGEAYLVRYADEDVHLFMATVRERLGKCGFAYVDTL